MRRMVSSIAAVAISAAELCAVESGAARAQAVDNSDIYVSVTELADEVELIREAMGRPFDDSARIPVSGITLYELYFHAETLLLKSSRLAYELAGAERAALPVLPDPDVSQPEILALVDRSLQLIRLVRDELGIVEEVRREERDTPIAATGVFSVMLDTNRQLNLLLDDAISSAEVYERLALAATYAAGLLDARMPGAERPVPVFEGPRLPADVYRALLECLDLATGVAERAGVETLTLSARRNVPDDITPGHVYDLAQFLVADLAQVSNAEGARPASVDLGPIPRHIFPSHSFELAELLQRQLEALAAAP